MHLYPFLSSPANSGGLLNSPRMGSDPGTSCGDAPPFPF